MKTLIFSNIAFIILCIFLFSCEGDQGEPGPKGDAGVAGAKGDQGDKGDQGEPGTKGETGNANVVQYTFGEQNLASLGYAQLQINTSLDTMNHSAWFAYLYYAPIKRWYFIPGYGSGAATFYRISMDHNQKVNIYIDKVGPGEKYDSAKVVRIYTNEIAAGGRAKNKLPDIDFSNYEAVKNYYRIPD